MTVEEIEQYLKGEGMPILKEEETELLNREITMRELKEALMRQKNNKTPGTDGLPMEFYKNLEESLNWILLETYEALSETKLPNTWREAYISLIPKEGADTTLIKNYRPMSLLNTNYKIFMNIIVNRMKKNIKR